MINKNSIFVQILIRSWSGKRVLKYYYDSIYERSENFSYSYEAPIEIIKFWYIFKIALDTDWINSLFLSGFGSINNFFKDLTLNQIFLDYTSIKLFSYRLTVADPFSINLKYSVIFSLLLYE